MTTIKIYPPKQLPSEGVSEPAFNIWREELEVYLEIDNRFQKFLPGGDYQTWEAAESFLPESDAPSGWQMAWNIYTIWWPQIHEEKWSRTPGPV